jgi:cell division protein FtsZ
VSNSGSDRPTGAQEPERGAARVRPFPARKERGGFDPNRLGDASRGAPVVPQIVGSGPVTRQPPAGGPPPIVPPASPAQRALQESEARVEPKGFTDVRIIGVGGGGGNAVGRMIEAGLQGVEFCVLNTDSQALELSQARRRIHLNTHGALRLGAGGDPDIGRRSAEDTEPSILDAIGNADMVFVTAGMGGGTGTGAAPFVAQLARRQHALTVGVVTLPFAFEGARRQRVALDGVKALREHVDALIVIPNDRLLTLSEKNTSMVQAFRRADDLLRQGVQGIADLVTVTGTINLDFADVRSVMEDAGRALMAVGEGGGENRALDAAQAVVTSPLLEHSISGASRILLNVTGGPDLTLYEVSEIAEHVTQAAHPDANIIFGHVVHPNPEVEVRVTLIATGMPDETPPARGTARSASRPLPVAPSGPPPGPPRSSRRPEDEPPPPARPEPAEETDNLDVPPFLRRPR